MREIFGSRKDKSTDYHEEVRKPFAYKENNPRPHKRQLVDAEQAIFLERRRSTDDKVGSKELETNPASEYTKVPCKHFGW